MAHLLYRLNQLPEDEIIEIRQLLDDAGIEYYETSGGNWGISLAAIWLHDDSQLEEAKEHLEKYHRYRAEAARQQPVESWWSHARRRPIKVLAFSALIAALFYLLLAPFVAMMTSA
ncbi:DUF6164 family protein [uncultured Pseudoteredinibacter sp.]|uniref:DUF6164 family protein n=1 Tax=uncultured Pseudoteredinibacter sp. TaxID=1641701 RepID=UPI0026322C96|nr:DUF6164 family protein [uncultured Pseudoteredinibacter sp.]